MSAPKPEPRASIDCGAHGFDAGAVSGDARLSALRGPAAVAVHDDRDVPRQTIPRNRRKQPLVATAFLNHFCEAYWSVSTATCDNLSG